MTKPRGPRQLCAWTLLAMLFATTLANATTSRREVNVVDLIANSELILRGTVVNLTDGIDNRGIPYTEVTLHVADAIRGQVSGDYTFRQFGLLKPRDMGNGTTNLMVTPAGWATYTKGEETILFLNKHAAWTGLQTTVGLGQGKFKDIDGRRGQSVEQRRPVQEHVDRPEPAWNQREARLDDREGRGQCQCFCRTGEAGG